MADSLFSRDQDQRDAQEELNTLNESLAAHGIECEDMNLEQKREMLTAVKMSEDTAKKEENLRSIQHDESLITDDESDSGAVADEPCISVKNQFPQQSILESRGTSLILVPTNKTCSNSNSDTECMVIEEVKCVRPPIVSTPRMSKLSLNPKEIRSVEKKIENENALSPIQGTPTKPKTRGRACEDKVRNIDVWNCEKSLNDMVFPDKRKVNYRPFYIRPKNMPVENYSAHFEKHQAILINRIKEYQSRSLNFMPWGTPIDLARLDSSALKSVESETCFEELDDNRSIFNGYRLRTRNSVVKRKVFSTISDKEESSEDEDILIPKRAKKTPDDDYHPSRTKKKNSQDFTFDALLFNTVNGKEEEHKTGKNSEKSALFTNVTNHSTDEKIDTNNENIGTPVETKKEQTRKENFDIQASSDEELSFSDAKVNKAPPKSKTRGPAKRKNVSKPTTRGKPTCRDDYRPEPDGAGWITVTKASNENDTIKPGPVGGAKLRRLFNPNSPIPTRQKGKAVSASKEIILPHEPNADVMSTEEKKCGQCPLCSKMFPLNLIEDHADQCCESAPSILNIDENVGLLTCPKCQKEYNQENLTSHDCPVNRLTSYTRFNRSRDM